MDSHEDDASPSTSVACEEIHGSRKTGNDGYDTATAFGTTATPTQCSTTMASENAAAAQSYDNHQNNKSSRLAFAKNGLLFTTMAKLYFQHQLSREDDFHGQQGSSSAEQWKIAVEEFYGSGVMDTTSTQPKHFGEVKRRFLMAVESRSKLLASTPSNLETQEERLCRQIMAAQETERRRVQQEQQRRRQDPLGHLEDGTQNNNHQNNRKRNRSAVSNPTTTNITHYTSNNNSNNHSKRKAIPPDIFFTPEMQERLTNVQNDLDAAKHAAWEVERAQQQLLEAQQRLEHAKVIQQRTAERAEQAATQFCAQLSAENNNNIEAGNGGPWKEMYDKLVAYHSEHKTCTVRGQTPYLRALRNWTLKQRERYFLKDTHPNKLPWYLARQLESLGFLWNYSDDSWSKHYKELQEFKVQHGHCAVPRSKLFFVLLQICIVSCIPFQPTFC